MQFRLVLQLLFHGTDAQSSQWVWKAFLGDADSIGRATGLLWCLGWTVLDGRSMLCSATSVLLVNVLASKLCVSRSTQNAYSTVFLLSAVQWVRRLVLRLVQADTIPSSLWFLALHVVDAVVCRRKGNDAAFCFGSGPEDKEVYIFVVSSLI